MKPRRLVLGLQKTVKMKRFAAHNQETKIIKYASG